MSNKKTTAYRLSIYISMAIITVLTAFIIIAYQFSYRILKENIDKNAISLSSEVILKVRDNVVAAQEIASNIGDQIPFYARFNSIELLISGLIQKYPFVQSIHVELDKDEFPYEKKYYSTVRKGNEIILSSDKQNSIKCKEEQDVFNSMLSSEKFGWSDPYYCGINNRVVSSFIMPIILPADDSSFIKGGYISVELSLNYLNKIISNTKVGERGYTFLISQNGTYITHPDEAKILFENIFNLAVNEHASSADSIRVVLSRGQSGSTIGYPEYLNFEKSWVYFSPILENNWTLIIIRPFAELYHDLQVMLLRLILISLLGLVVIFILINFIINKLMSPLSQLISKIHEFSLGKDKIKSKNEVVSLTKSLNQLQIWVERNKLSEEQTNIQFRKFRSDLKQASEIQQSIIPNTFPPFPERNEIEISATYKPALVISGDLFEYFFVDDDHLLITIGDVSGKGIPAAMFMGVAHTLLQGRSFGRKANQIVKEINEELADKNQNQFFLTLFVGILNVKTGVLNYCNAAHTSTKILRNGDDLEELSDTHGLPLGLYSGREYQDSSTKLEINDTLILYTDGVTDLVDEYDNHYGEGRFKESLKGLREYSPGDIIIRIDANLDQFRGETPIPDDISMVVLKFQPK